MDKPRLIIVTGRPGAGKTTLAAALGNAACMQVLSRDKIKEGYVHTAGKGHDALPQDVNRTVNQIFFQTVKALLMNHVSLIIEAAFQHRVWHEMLEGFDEIANMTFVICTLEDQAAFDRYIKRGLAHASRVYFHGDAGVQMAKNNVQAQIPAYTPPQFDVPTFYVHTLGEYAPSIPELIGEILGAPMARVLIGNL